MTIEKRIIVQHYKSPCGELLLGAYEGRLCLCDWTTSSRHKSNLTRTKKILKAQFSEGQDPVLKEAAKELDEYFTGTIKSFKTPLLLVGTEFQKGVWNSLKHIPFGNTCSYSEIALGLGKKNGTRAVAQAIGSNPIAIILPCHRVVGKNGKLTGYAGGIAAKQLLLNLEKA